MNKIFLLLLFLCVLSAVNACEVTAADFSVDPVNVLFEAGQRATVLTVRNQSDDRLTLQLTAYAWDQDERGKDVYTPSDDVIIFPKILSVERGAVHVVRLGIKIPPGKEEKTFRVYLEEILGPQKPQAGGAELRTIMRVGVPIFVLPVSAEPAGEIEVSSFSKGSLSFVVRNLGNDHFILKSVLVNGFDKAGDSLYKTEFGGWYLLKGRSRSYMATIPGNICSRIDHVTIDVDTGRLSLKERLDVRTDQCSP